MGGQLDCYLNPTYSNSMRKQRLDRLLLERGLVKSIDEGQRLIMAAQVLVNGQIVDKAGMLVPITAEIELRQRSRYVSRGGFKLEAALHAFHLDVDGLVVADIGASTGGFTDCLLQHGAARVYAIDVGYGQLAWQLRQDSRVIVMDRANIREGQTLPELVDLATIDVSFISLKLVLPPTRQLLKPDGQIIALIKPQFEAARDEVEPGGVVRDRDVHRRVLHDIAAWAESNGLHVRGLVPSPIRGPAGNIEFLVHLALQHDKESTQDEMIEQALAAADESG